MDSPLVQAEIILPQEQQQQQDTTAIYGNAHVGVDAVMLREIEAYRVRSQKMPVQDYVHVYENHLPAPFQECGSCQFGSKVYITGGYNETKWWNQTAPGGSPAEVALGENHFWIYDMQDMTTVKGPDMPSGANHLPCAISAKGILHVSGGYRQDAERGVAKAYHRHWAMDLNIPQADLQWVQKADMPLPRGAHGCAFLKDDRLYCTGGAPDVVGPFARELQIYDPLVDTWTLGPNMHEARNHVMHVATLMDGNALYVVGGRSHYGHLGNAPYFWTSAYSAKIYDIRKGEWQIIRGPSTPREASAVINYPRYGDEQDANILIVGGQRFYGMSGHTIHTICQVKGSGRVIRPSLLLSPLGRGKQGRYNSSWAVSLLIAFNLLGL
jgi:hypothetical protein